MGRDVDFKKALENLINITSSGDTAKINEAKINALWEVPNLFELIINYVYLESIGYHFSLGSEIIKKGTALYRIRDYVDTIDFSNPSEWEPSPFKNQNRANRKGKEALYLASSEMLCFLETHKKPNEKYVLGKYECLEDIQLGGFFGKKAFSNLEWLAIDILNAFLIAPSRSEKNKELFQYLDKKFGQITLDDLSSLKDCVLDSKQEMLLPYKFAVLNRKNGYYNLTNQLCEIIEKENPNGIKYSSCYIPMGNPFINCSEYNVALYTPALQNVRFIGCEAKTLDIANIESFSDVTLAKILLGDFQYDQS